MDILDIMFLALMLVGVVMMIIAQVLKHKGMWNLTNDDMPFNTGRRGFDSPYQVTSFGVMLFAIGLCAEIGYTFGIKAGFWSAVTAAVINAVINVIRLKHIEEDDKDLRLDAAVNIGMSAFVLFISGLMLFLI